MSASRLFAAAGVALVVSLPATARSQGLPLVRSPATRADSLEAGFRLAAAVAPQTARRMQPGRLLRIGKWTMLGAAVGMGAYALVRSQDAEQQYEALRQLCDADQSRCQLQGRQYADPEAEALYQTAILHDRRARIGIIGAQVSLLGSVALFIADLENDRGPADIPYPSRFRPVTAVGLRFTR